MTDDKSERGRQSFNKVEVECYKHHKLGYFQYECPIWENNANYFEVKEEQKDEPLLIASIYFKEEKGKWFLDTGCSNHMSGN